MTTLTPFRLFQICKYALHQYTSNSTLINRTRRKAELLRDKVQAIRRDRKRTLVGYHVEERRGWDVKPDKREGAVVGLDQAKEEGMKGGAYPLRIPSSEGLAGSTTMPRKTSKSIDLENYRHTPSSSSSSPPPPPPDPYSDPSTDPSLYPNEISRLMAHPALFTPSFKAPRNVIVLCHGLYGFSTATPIPLFPSLKLHYWHSVLSYLREQLGCKVMVVGVKGTGSIEERAGEMDRWLKEKLPKGTGVNFVAHSMVSRCVRPCRHGPAA